MTLPNFLLIGAAKTGTTSVDRRRELVPRGLVKNEARDRVQPHESMIRATLRKCLTFLDPPARWRWAGLVPLAVAGAVLEAVGAVTVFALIKIINNPSQIASLPVVSTLYAVLPWH